MDSQNAPTTPNNPNVSIPMNEFLEMKLQQNLRAQQQGVMPAPMQGQGQGTHTVPPHGWPPGHGPMPIATAVPTTR